MNNIIKTIALEMKWTPEILRQLYIDEADSDSLIFWYNEILRKFNHAANH
jgi:hypothetical protein